MKMQTGISEILIRYPKETRNNLIPILQDIQENDGYLSKEAVVEVGKWLQVPTSKIYGVATFYNQFRFNAPGKYHIQICRGTACHVLNSATVLEELEKQLKIKAGQTTSDNLFSIEVVACIGACGLAPVLCINGEFHARVTPGSIKNILDGYREREVQL
jgi:NADH-quinone oxidoreductase subunit E